MSNHSGSYMLNGVLLMLARESYFSKVGPEKTSEFIADVLRLAGKYDCNHGEILGDVSETLGLCRWCLKHGDDLVDGSCPSCR